MASPVLARLDDDDDRFYVWKGETFWSVTTIIGGGVPKFALAPWYGKIVAEVAHDDIAGRGEHARAHAALRRWARVGRLEVIARQAAGELKSVNLSRLSERDLALRFLKGAPERTRDEAARLGIAVHESAEDLVLDLARSSGEAWSAGRDWPAWPDHLAPHLASFRAFLEDWDPVYLATEATVFNRAQAYAGTLDAIIRIQIAPGVFVVVVLDYKSGRAVYPEVGLQLSAYRRGEFLAGPDHLTEIPLPAIDGAAVLHLTPKGYALRMVRADDAVYDAFRFAREVFRWGKFTARTVLGDPLRPLAREEVPA